jgi:hypothetical protein
MEMPMRLNAFAGMDVYHFKYCDMAKRKNGIRFPLNELQISLLRLSENLSEQELLELRKRIIDYKAKRLVQLADKVWDEKGWTEETMQGFLKTHMRTPYKPDHSEGTK